ncbi:DNA methyltransferase [Campylobacter hominis]|uniref:DNA methyltransferase n=1 Tax=Campylobacter hominis TaxID=76517 RepID=UPI00248B4D5E|nr:DNA methyltransferase [Campylobacter hominis]
MIKNTILQGDCLKILKTLPDKSIDLIFADLPYWMKVDGILKRPEGENFSGCDDKWDNNFLNNDDYSQFTEKWLNECKIVLKNNEIRKK